MSHTSKAQKRQRANALECRAAVKRRKLSENADPTSASTRGPSRAAIAQQNTIIEQREALVDLKNCVGTLHTQISELKCTQKNACRTAAYWREKVASIPSIESLLAEIDSQRDEITSLKLQLSACEQKLQQARAVSKAKSAKLSRSTNTRSRLVAATAVKSRRFLIKDRGEVPEHIRALIRTLYCRYNVSQRNIWPVVRLVAEAAGLDVVGSFGHSLVALCIREGGIASHMRFVELCKRASCMSLSTDGTNDRQQHYQSTWCTFKLDDGTIVRHFLGMRRLVEHTSEAQLNDLTKVLKSITECWNTSPLGSMSPIELGDVLRITRGTNLDHAAEMKKFNRLLGELKRHCDRIERGKSAWLDLDYVTHQARCAEVIDTVVAEHGGVVAFYALSDTEQDRLLAEGQERMWLQMGEDELKKLSSATRATVDLWFWFGCMMHKELNVVKAGCTGMEQVREEFGLAQPMKWLNKDNDAAAQSGSTELRARAERESQSGGAKLGISIASFLRNKQHDKGVQRKWNDWIFVATGRHHPCPDAGRVRFHTTTGVCQFIMHHYHHLIEFLDEHFYSKTTPGFNHFEQNIYNALHDLPTLTDVAVLAVVHQTMSAPYASATRAESLNAIHLGPLHADVKTLCNRLADDPSLVLGDPGTSYKLCTLGGQPYQSTETIVTVRRFYEADLLPEFELVLAGFMRNARDKWDDFTEEFAQGSALELASQGDLDLVFLPTTNDRNEGTLGQTRCAHRRAPNISDAMLSCSLGFRHNDLEKSMENLSPSDHAFTRAEARAQVQSSSTKRDSVAAVAHLRKIAADRKIREAERAAQAKHEAEACTQRCETLLGTGKLILDPNAACFQSETGSGRMTVQEINAQLEWHRYNGLPEGHPSKISKVKSHSGSNRSERLATWRQTLVAYQEYLVEHPTDALVPNNNAQ